MAKRKHFGTDGVRGRANTGKMTPDHILRMGMAAAQHFRTKKAQGDRGEEDVSRNTVVIGKDTRLSGDMVEAALVAGLTSVGFDVRLAGVLPTSGVSLMTRTLRADLGVMITASHNAYPDNGVKFFGPDGTKLTDADETAIETLMEAGWKSDLPTETGVGRVARSPGLQARYIEIAKATLPRHLRLSGLKIVIDCANGAAHNTAPATLWELGADAVIPIGVDPDGTNINADCGSTHTNRLSDRVVAEGANVGIALDGDADRLIMCDERGTIIDGDQLLGLMASSWQARNLLTRPGIVATVMSNLGLERFLADQSLDLVRTAVGDRHVAARMRADGYNLGGEQSGHLLMTPFSPTGDGTMAALQVLAEMLRQDRPASDVLDVFTPVPQRLVNVAVTPGTTPLSDATVVAAMRDAESRLGSRGRILVRASGTEPLIRIMAEGDDAEEVRNVTDALAETVSGVV